MVTGLQAVFGKPEQCVHKVTVLIAECSKCKHNMHLVKTKY